MQRATLNHAATPGVPSSSTKCTQVELSAELWQIVLDQASDIHHQQHNNGPVVQPERIGVCILSSSHRPHPSASGLPSVVCWARRTSREAVLTEVSLCAERTLTKAHPSILGPANRSVRIAATRPVALSQIILCAIDQHAYDAACENKEEMEEWLNQSQRILRQGETVSIPLPSARKKAINGHTSAGLTNGTTSYTHTYRILMAQPVLQGYADPAKTEFILTISQQPQSLESFDAQPAESNIFTSLSNFELDDDFLAASVFEPSLPNHTLLNGLTNGHQHSPVFSPSTASDINASSILSVPIQSRSRGRTVKTHAMAFPVPLYDDIVPRPEESVDESLVTFFSTMDLAKYGFFSGDAVEISDSHQNNLRLVKVYASDDAPEGHLSCSPLLLLNMKSPSTLHLSRPVKVDYTYERAQSVSIARVASEHTMHKQYQSVVLSALKAYFQNRYRIVKQGDLLAVPIDEKATRFQSNEDDKVVDPLNAEDGEQYTLPLSDTKSTAIAWFKVINVEAPTESSKAGQYGYLIDPMSTRMVQTGVANAAIVDMDAYLGIDCLPPQPDLFDHTMSVTPAYSHLVDYLRAAMRPGSSVLGLDMTVMLKGARGSGKATLARWAARAAGMHIIELDCYELVGDTDVKTEGNLTARWERVSACTPCILLLRHLDALGRKSQTLETGQEPAIASILQECLDKARDRWKETGFPLVTIGTSSDAEKIPTSIIKLFKEDIMIDAPSEAERLAMLKGLLRHDILAPDVSLKSLAVQSAALVACDLVNMVDRARLAYVARLEQSSLSLSDCRDAGIALTEADFTSALDKARSFYSESIGAPKIPNVTWDDVGGLASVKSEILDTIQLPLDHPELFSDGLKKRSGVLLYGPPGTGKTLLAKAVATSCSLNFFSVKGPELLNMYIGESEANVRRVFQRARDAKPCVIFFDELDSVAPKRGNQGDSGGVMDRIVSQLLAELDGMAEGKGGADVFVIGATNRPDLLDPALLRPGRFDRMLYLGVSDNHESQRKIIEALTRKFKLDPDIDLHKLAEACPFNYTGADFYALCSDALLKAMARKAEETDARIAELNKLPQYQHAPLTPQYYLAEMAKPQEIEVLVSQRDFEAALAELVPSVSEAEMAHYRVVQQRFSSTPAPEKADTKGKGKARPA